MAARARKGGPGKRVGTGLGVVLLLLLVGGIARVPILREISSAVFTPAQRVLRGIVSVGRLSSENERLRHAAVRFALENFSLREARYENVRLRRMLDFAAASGFDLEPADIVAREAGPFGRGLKIGKGERSGLEPNMPVVTHEGLVGKIIEVNRDASFIQYIRDPDFRVSALVQRSRTTGILAWEPGSGVRLRDVPLHADVEEGDLVVTSGLGEVFPKGILLGRVTQASDGEGRLFKELWIEPFVDISHLEEVFVITGLVRRDPLGPGLPQGHSR